MGTTVHTKSNYPVRIQENNMSDWDFIRRLAIVNRFDLWVDWSREKKNWVVHFKRHLDAGDAEYEFEYGKGYGTLLRADPEFTIHDTPTGVEVVWMDKQKKSIEATIITEENDTEDVMVDGVFTPGNLKARKTMIDGARIRFTAFDQLIETFVDRPFKSKKAAKQFAERWLNDRSEEFINMEFTVIGLPTMRPRQIHKLIGLSKRLDGFYRVNKVKHVMQPGKEYVCEVSASKILSDELSRLPKLTSNKVKKEEKTDPNAEPDISLAELTNSLRSIKLQQVGDKILNRQQVGKRDPAYGHFRSRYPGSL